MTAEDVVDLVLGRRVRCLMPEAQMLCHTGYPPHLGSYDDVWALHRRFGIPLPDEYRGPRESYRKRERRSDVGTYDGATTFSTRS
jgi:hypothetical protein